MRKAEFRSNPIFNLKVSRRLQIASGIFLTCSVGERLH